MRRGGAGASSTWRQGRSLPYGEGISFWALAEIVKAQAGILESDSRTTRRGSSATVADGRRRPERGRLDVARGCGPLVGLGGGEDGRGAERERSRPGGASSRRSPRSGRWCSSSRTCTGPTTGCSTSSTSSPTGRGRRRSSSSARRGPSCSSAGPAGAGGRRTRRRSRCSPLSDEETARLFSSLLNAPVLPAETQAELLARAAGNPLYAEQFARMLAERGDGRTALPETRAGDHRRPPRRALARRRRRCSRTRRSSARSSGSAPSARSAASSASRPRRRCTRSSARSSSGARGARRSRARRSTRSGTCSSATSPTARSRARPARREAPRRRGVARGARPARGPRGDARLALPERARVRARRGEVRGREVADRARSACATPASAPRRSTPGRRRPASTPRRWRSGREPTRSGRTWPTNARSPGSAPTAPARAPRSEAVDALEAAGDAEAAARAAVYLARTACVAARGRDGARCGDRPRTRARRRPAGLSGARGGAGSAGGRPQHARSLRRGDRSDRGGPARRGAPGAGRDAGAPAGAAGARPASGSATRGVRRPRRGDRARHRCPRVYAAAHGAEQPCDEGGLARPARRGAPDASAMQANLDNDPNIGTRLWVGAVAVEMNFMLGGWDEALRLADVWVAESEAVRPRSRAIGADAARGDASARGQVEKASGDIAEATLLSERQNDHDCQTHAHAAFAVPRGGASRAGFDTPFCRDRARRSRRAC